MIVCLQLDANFFTDHNFSLFNNFGHSTGTDRSSAFADSEAEAFFHCDRSNELDLHLDIVARHDHLDACRKVCDSCHVSCTEVELWAVACKERCMSSAFFFGQDIGLSLELRVRRDRARFGDDLSAFDLFTLNSSQKQPDVVACHSRVEQLLEHLNARHDRVSCVLDAHDLDRLVDVDLSTLNTACSHRASSLDRQDVFHRHQQRLVHFAFGCRNVAVYGSHQLVDLRLPGSVAFQSFQC